ncbi:hypothetical protein BCV69DRAFT_168725 [Microstroma glucosiphilum]|uniref:Uncharacterized protein n=1 Tax=Pseudomicrostroma glucosiphilum TaxID=1684307 RepID=A0A316UAE2_9BASI|nr:hypothetical protein BCV69DRAFT_168725 [Pseudomicrostroma glucosiphilum]PWN21383.1 hypothetical protein BCV69DRAFT_168725 [Pseudomicrostroma glucosiphilum]
MSNDAATSSLPTTTLLEGGNGQLAEALASLSIDGREPGFTQEQAEALLAYCEREAQPGHNPHRLVFRGLATYLNVAGKSSQPLDAGADFAKRVLKVVITALKHALCTDRSRGSSEDIMEQASLLSAGLKAIHAAFLSKEADGAYCITLDQPDLSTAVELLLSCAHYLPRLPTSQSSTIRTFEPNSFPRRGSAVSLRAESLYGTDDGTDWGSDVTTSQAPSTEAQQRKKISSTTRTVRQNAVSCLAALNEIVPAQLFSHWPKVLSRTSPSVMRLSGPLNAAPHSEPILSVIWTDPVLSVRLGVCHLLESMFKQARARGFLQSGVVEQLYGGIGSRFTSLSARMGSLVSEVRSFMVDFLEVAAGGASSARSALRGERSTPPAALVEAMLRATSTFIIATRLAKLKKSHADVLRDPILRLTSHAEPGIAIAAFNTLSTLTKASGAATSSRQASRASHSIVSPPSSASSYTHDQEGNSAAVSSLMRRLGEDSSNPGVLAEAWHALLGFAQQKPLNIATHQDWLHQRISKHLTSNDQSLRHACVTFLVYMARTTASTEDATSPTVLDLLTPAADDVSPLVRAEVLQALPNLLASEPNNDQIRNLLNRLIEDGEGTVRAAAIRAVGLLLVPGGDIEDGQAAKPLPPAIAIPYAAEALGLDIDNQTHSSMAPTSPLTDTMLLVRLRASWTLGNLCQSIKSLASPSASPSTPHLLLILLTASTKLLYDDERIAINALRSTGLVLSIVDAQWLHDKKSIALSPRSVHMERALRGLLQAVRAAKNPKTKWNGLNALQAALSNEIFRQWLNSTSTAISTATLTSTSTSTSFPVLAAGDRHGELHGQVIHLLSEHLAHKTFKVKLAAIGSLLLMLPLPLPTLTPPGLDLGLETSAATETETETEAEGNREQSLTSAVQEALQRLDAEVAEGNFAEVGVHGVSVRRGLEELMERLACPV